MAYPTDARLMHRTRERLVRLAKKQGVVQHQSYERVSKYALIKQRYAHAKQFKRARHSLKTLRTYLGRVIRDITRKIKDQETLQQIFAHELMLALRVHAGNRSLRPFKEKPAEADLRVFSLQAPEVECIGLRKTIKGKPHKPYEFGVKISLATTLKRSKGGQFIVQGFAQSYGTPAPAPAAPSIASDTMLSPRAVDIHFKDRRVMTQTINGG